LGGGRQAERMSFCFCFDATQSEICSWAINSQKTKKKKKNGTKDLWEIVSSGFIELGGKPFHSHHYDW
jgi:hypothetical protein